jgi:hypothetical protein
MKHFHFFSFIASYVENFSLPTEVNSSSTVILVYRNEFINLSTVKVGQRVAASSGMR